VLFGNAHIKKTFRILPGKGGQAGSFRHGGGQGNDAFVVGGQLAERGTEDGGIGRRAPFTLDDLAGFLVKGPHPVEQGRVFFGRLVALTLFGQHMDQHRALVLLHLFQGFHQHGQVVAVDRAEVFEPEGFEEHAGGEENLEGFLQFFGQVQQVLAHGVETPEKSSRGFLETVYEFAGAGAGQEVGQGADVFGNRHFIVVQDHDHVPVHVTGVVHGLVGHTAGHGAVADHGQDLVPAPGQITSGGKAGGGGDGGGGVAHIKAVVGRFIPLGKPADAVLPAQGGKTVAPAGQQLVGIGLVPHVPDDLVVGGGEDPVQGNGQLHHPQAGRQVAAVFGAGFNDHLAQFSRKVGQEAHRQAFQIGGGIDCFQNWHGYPRVINSCD